MKKIISLLILLSSSALAGTITIYQDSGGGIGSVIMTPANQIFLDATATSGHQTGVGDLTWPITINAGNNRALLVGCGLTNSEDISTVTIGGFTLSVATKNIDAGTQEGVAIYYSTSPPIGAYSVDVQTVNGIMDHVICWAQSYTGVDQNSPIDGKATSVNNPGSGTSLVTFTTAFTHGLVADVLVDGNADTPVVGAGQTEIMFSGNSSAEVLGSYKTTTNAGSYTMSWTAVSVPLVQGAVGLKAAQ